MSKTFITLVRTPKGTYPRDTEDAKLVALWCTMGLLEVKTGGWEDINDLHPNVTNHHKSTTWILREPRFLYRMKKTG